MSVACTGPDPSLGVALRLSDYLDCQAAALGENGFQTLAGGPLVAGLLSGFITIFVALVGYRLILGAVPAARDGVGWAVRIGVVLALATSWPAFQALVYRVAANGPDELAAILVPAAGLPAQDMGQRIQYAYDTLRLGSGEVAEPTPQPAAQATTTPAQPTQQASLGQSPLPLTASMLVVTTVGFAGAMRIAIGFLLAVAPLAIMGLLFDATTGLFSGWVRAIAGTALGLLAATIVSAIELLTVEGEIAHVQAYAGGGIAEAVDTQALPTIVLLFAVVMLAALFVAWRMAGAFRLPIGGGPWRAETRPASAFAASAALPSQATATEIAARRAGTLSQPRAAAVAEALASTVRREQGEVSGYDQGLGAPSRTTVLAGAATPAGGEAFATPKLGLAGRRTTARQSRSAAARDRSA